MTTQPLNSSEVEHRQEFDRLWKTLKVTLARERDLTRVPPPARPFPQHLQFGERGNAVGYQIFGWNHAELTHTWSEGAESVVELPAPLLPMNHFLNVQVRPFLAGGVSCQRVQVSIGTVCVAEWEVAEAGHYFALLPGCILDRTNELKFHFSNPTSPAKVGISDDDRELALSFFHMWLTPWRNPEI